MRIESPPLNDEHTDRDVDTEMSTPIWMKIEHPGWAARLVAPEVSRVISSRATADKLAGE